MITNLKGLMPDGRVPSVRGQPRALIPVIRSRQMSFLTLFLPFPLAAPCFLAIFSRWSSFSQAHRWALHVCRCESLLTGEFLCLLSFFFFC